MDFPAIFRMEPTGKDGEYECESRLLFCSPLCRQNYLVKSDPEYAPGIILTTEDRPFFGPTQRNVILFATDNWVNGGEICNNCGKPFEAPNHEPA